MRVLVFSDIHGDRAALEALMERDEAAHIGDGDPVPSGRGLHPQRP